MKVIIYTDGSSRGNPGPGGCGAILQYTDKKGGFHEKELSQGYKNTTNNRMELMGAIKALEELKMPCEVELHSDSRYLVDAFNKGWVKSWQAKDWKKSDRKPVLNQDLWQRLLLAAAPHNMTFIWVEGHAGDAENERCDKLATAAADGDSLLDDDCGFSAGY